jgi:UDP-N-acetylglucosamine diphosphorylase/glucosamine-1-phosphate N-acetyltransferase
MVNICIFEDNNFSNLYPLVYLRPVFELRCGITTLREKIETAYPEAKVWLLFRGWLREVVAQRIKNQLNDLDNLIGKSALFINGRALLSIEDKIPAQGGDEVFFNKGEIVAFRLKEVPKIPIPLTTAFLRGLKNQCKLTEVKISVIKYPWDLINHNGETIKEDFLKIKNQKSKIKNQVMDAEVYGDKTLLYIGKGSRVEAGTILHLEEGPIYIGDDVIIRSPTIIDGPCYIGDGTIIDGAKIRYGTSIGPVCRIAGEVEESIIQGYTNKHHRGFLGHSYLCEWVNLGALTTNSDLKNNYGQVKVYINGELLNTQNIKVGCFIGDYTKTGIGTMINTGSVYGVGANVFGAEGVLPKFIPSFAWGGKDGFVEYRLEKFLADSKIVMSRRKIEQTKADRELLRKVYELTCQNRQKAGVKGGEQ